MVVDPRVWGNDVAISLARRDFVRSQQAGLAEIDGADNVQGAVLRRLDTPFGDLPAHPDYGCAVWDMLGDALVQGWPDRVLAAVRLCLAQEPRIAVTGLRIGIVAELGRVDVGVSYMLLGQPGERNLIWSIDISRVRSSIPA